MNLPQTSFYFVTCLVLISWPVAASGVPGLVLDDYSKLYTEILQREGADESINLQDSIKFNLEPLQQLTTKENITSFVLTYISTIDRNVISGIQKLTENILVDEKKALEDFNKFNVVFSRECLPEIGEKFTKAIEKQNNNKLPKDKSCQKRIDWIIKDPKQKEVEVGFLISHCIQLESLNAKQKFMRGYAGFYVALEKLSDCAWKDTGLAALNCVKLEQSDLPELLKKIERVDKNLNKKISDFKRFAPACCSLLKNHLEDDDFSFCL